MLSTTKLPINSPDLSRAINLAKKVGLAMADNAGAGVGGKVVSIPTRAEPDVRLVGRVCILRTIPFGGGGQIAHPTGT